MISEQTLVIPLTGVTFANGQVAKNEQDHSSHNVAIIRKW